MSDPRRPSDDRSADAPNRREERRPNRLLPILLIGAGLLLLAGRFGVFDWRTALGILELWPLLLIALGADILTRGRYRLPIVLGAVLLGAFLYRAPAWVPIAGGGGGEVHEVAVERGSARSAEIELDHGIGRLTLDALPADSDLVLGGEVTTGRREGLVQEASVRGDVARVRLASRRRGFFVFGIDVGGGDRAWSLGLNDELPADLDLDTGVGDSLLNLRDVTLTNLELDSGVGDVRLTLPETGGYAAEIDSGVGEVRVRIPRSVEARVVVDSGIGDVEVQGDWSARGDAHETPGYGSATAAQRVDLRIDGGVGEITVTRID